MLRHSIMILAAILLAAGAQVGLIWRGAHGRNVSLAQTGARGLLALNAETRRTWSAVDGPCWYLEVHREGSVEERAGLAVPARAATRAMRERALAELPPWSVFRDPPDEDDLAANRRVVVERVYGWPMVSMRSLIKVDSVASPAMPAAVTVLEGLEYSIALPGPVGPGAPAGIVRLATIPAGGGVFTPPVLPEDILWTGFLVNTAALAPFAWLAVAIMALWVARVRQLRRYARWRRRECPRCRYQLHDDASGCPECGWGRDDPGAIARYASWGTKRPHRRRARARRSRQARVAGLLVGALLLGGMTTVAVAWGCALWVNVFGTFERATVLVNGDSELVVVWRRRVAGAMHVGTHQRNYDLENDPPRNQFKRVHTTSDDNPIDWIPSWGNLTLEGVVLGRAADMGDPNASEVSHQADARGWPFLALWSEYEQKRGEGSGWRYDVKRGGIRLGLAPWNEGPSGYPYEKSLPLIPIWRGVLFNAGIYSGAWLVILLAVGWARRRYRVWLRFCAHCGADVRGLEGSGSRLCLACRAL